MLAENLEPSLIMERLLDEVIVVCQCGWTGRQDAAVGHVDTCEFMKLEQAAEEAAYTG